MLPVVLFMRAGYAERERGVKRAGAGGEGKESNLPSRARRDNAVLKTGEATGPHPSPSLMLSGNHVPPSGATRSPRAIVPANVPMGGQGLLIIQSARAARSSSAGME